MTCEGQLAARPPQAAAAAWARIWIDADPDEPALPVGLPSWPWRDLAVELRRECYRAWTTAPGEAQTIARTLARMAAQSGDPWVDAFAVWVKGIAALVRGQPQHALEVLCCAEAALLAQGQVQAAEDTGVPQMVCLAMLGRDGEAVQRGVRALAAFDARGDELAAGKVEQNLGSLLLRQDRYADAATHFRRAALRFARVGDHAHSIMADNGLASVLTAQYRFDEALQMAERARQRAQSRGLVPLLATIHNVLGRLELLRGRLGTAMHWLALVLRDADRGAPPQSVAEAQRTLADAYRAANLLPESVALYNRTIDSARQRQAPIEEAWALVQRAWVQARLTLDGFARDDLDRARQIFLQQGNSVGLAVVHLHEAALALHDGWFERAREYATLAATGFDLAGLQGGQLEARVLLAQCEEQTGDAEAAGAIYRRALECAQDLPQIMAPCAQGLGRLARRRADWRTARDWFTLAKEQYERQRQTLVGDELRTAFADNTQAVHDALVELASARLSEDGPWPLLQAIEGGRARALHHGMQDGTPGEAGADDAQLRSLRARLAWLQGQWQQAVVAAQAERSAHWQSERRRAEADLLEYHRQWQLAQQRAPQPVVATSSGPDLLSLIETDQALVLLHCVGERLMACVLRPQGLQTLDWLAPGLEARIDRMRFQISSQRFRATALQTHRQTLLERARLHLQALYEMIWAPLEEALRGARQVTVLPHRKLHYLPFGALHDGRGWLAERLVFSHAPSLAVWCSFNRWRLPVDARVVAAGVGGDCLPHVAAELDAVRHACGVGTRVLADAAATTAALREALPGAHLVHLACHGEFRADSPYFSQLSLADGPLTLSDATTLPLGGSLVTLSACETGVNLVAAGDEVIGLVRGFLLAGAAGVVSTLWTVDDQATASLMTRFYSSLRRGLSPAASLAEAQRDLMVSHPHPYHWASFTVHGRD